MSLIEYKIALGNIRSIVQQNILSTPRAYTIWNELKVAASSCSERYFAEVVPYLAGFDWAKEPLAMFSTRSELEWAMQLAPCAWFALGSTMNEDDVTQLVESSAIERVVLLDLSRVQVSMSTLELFWSCKRLVNLKSLRVRHTCFSGRGRFDDEVLQQFLSLSKSRIIEEVELFQQDISDAGALLLANAQHLSQLRRLYLQSCRIGDQGVMALATGRIASQLEHLELEGNPFGFSGFEALATSPLLAHAKQIAWVEQYNELKHAKAPESLNRIVVGTSITLALLWNMIVAKEHRIVGVDS